MKFLHLLLIFVLLFFFAGAVLAQDDAPLDDTAVRLDIQALSGADEAEVLAESLLKLIYNSVYLPFAAPLVLLLVAVSKRFTTLNANILSLFFSVIIWAFWIAANEVGLGGQFESIVSGVTTIAVAVLGSTITPAASGKLYAFARDHDVALFGFERTPQAA